MRFSIASIVTFTAIISSGTLFTWAQVKTPHQGAQVYNFENNLAYWSSASHTYKDNGFKAGVDAKAGVDGKPALFIRSANPEQDEKSFYVNYWQSFKPDKYIGKKIEFTGYVKTKDLKGFGGLWMKINEDAEVTAFDNLSTRPLEENSDWKKVSIVLDVQKNTTRITIGLYMRGGGEVWMSNINVSEAPAKAQTTNISFDAKKHSIFKDELNAKPVNLDFSALAVERGPLQILQWACHTPGDSYKVYVDRQTKFNDKVSACIEANSDSAPGFASLFQDLSSQNYKGKKVKFSGFIKTKDVSDWSGIWMRVDDATQVLAFDNMEDRPVTGTNDWKEYDVVLEVPKESKKIKVGVMQAGKGKSWFNNCHFEPVDASVATTGKKIVSHEPVNDLLPELPNLEFKSR